MVTRAHGFAAAVLSVSVLPAGAAQARSVTIHQRPTPQVTLTVPSGWTAHPQRHVLLLTRGRDRLFVRACPLDRDERDMTGRHAASFVQRAAVGIYAAPAAGGGCVTVAAGRTAHSVAQSVAHRLHARLGPAGPALASDASAEATARAARTRTLGQLRAQGTAFAVPFGAAANVGSSWEWDLATGYQHQVQQLTIRPGSGAPIERDEIVHDAGGDHLRLQDETCWSSTPAPTDDDALEPRLELHEWDAPPSTATAWRVAYSPPAPRPDGSTLLRWTGFVAGGTALVGPDGLLRSVRIIDHHQARGRTVWRVVEVAFTAFPAQIAPVSPGPACS